MYFHMLINVYPQLCVTADGFYAFHLVAVAE